MYKIYCCMPQSEQRFRESTVEDADAVIDYVFSNRWQYDPIKVFQCGEDGWFDCVLKIQGGQPLWGEPSIFEAAQIRAQELDWWPEIAADPEYKRVTSAQVFGYYEEQREEILNSLWQEMPEFSEVVVIMAERNNPELFSAVQSALIEESPGEDGSTPGWGFG